MPEPRALTRNIFFALIVGVMVGIWIPDISPWVSWLGLIFKLSLSMIVMPIILTSIIGGMGAIGDVRKLEGLGVKTITYFMCSTILAIILGLVLVYFIQPGVREPEPGVRAALEQGTPNNASDAPLYFLKKLTESSLKAPQAVSLKYFETSLTDLVHQGYTVEEIRGAAIKIAGSFEFRERLEKNQQSKTIKALSFEEFFQAQINKALVNPFEALAEKHVLAVIIFAILFGGALGTLGAQGRVVFDFVHVIDLAITKMVGLIMHFAPFGVFGLVVDVVAGTGIGIFLELGLYSVCVISGLLIHGFLVLPLLMRLLTGFSPKKFLIGMRPAIAIAFATSSSNATLPVSIECVEEGLKIRPQITRFVLPLGATINMNGTALYEAVAAVFIAQLYGMSLGLSSQILIGVTAALAAIGAAGIPAAGTVTMALVLSAVGLPLEGIGLLLAVDRPLDMLRTTINVIGDAVGAVVLSKWSKNLA